MKDRQAFNQYLIILLHHIQLNNHFNHNNSKFYPLNYANLIKHDTLIFLYFVYSFLHNYPVFSYI